MAGVAISGTEDEDSSEYFDDHEDAGELLGSLVDNAEAEEATKAKLEELERVWSVRDRVLARCSREEAGHDTLGSGPQKRRNQSTIRRKRVQGRRNNV